jgi:hypothetical protein
LTRAAGLLLAAVLLAGACASPLERPALAKTRFVLDPGRPPAAAAAAPDGAGAAGAGSLLVARVRVSPLFDHKAFVYRTGAETFESDPYHEWFAQPGDVLREATLGWLEEAGLFSGVERRSVSGSEWLLETVVDRLYTDRRDPDAPAAVLAGRFRLLDLRGARPRRALELRFDEREPAGDGAPQALVDAWGRALGRALETLAPELRAAVTSRARADGAR